MASRETSSQQIDILLSTLSSSTAHNWKSVLRINKRHQRKYASLLRLKAFHVCRFTDDAMYQKGKSVLEVQRQQKFRGNADAKVQQFQQLMGPGYKSDSKKVYLSRDLLNGTAVKAAFRQFKRPFGEVDPLIFSPKPKSTAQIMSMETTKKAAVKQYAGTNEYIKDRMEKLFCSNSVSKEMLLRRSASAVLPDFPGALDNMHKLSPKDKSGRLRKKRKGKRVLAGLRDSEQPKNWQKPRVSPSLSSLFAN